MLFIGCYNRSEKGKGKGISLFSIPYPRIKPEKKDLAARWLFNIGLESLWRVCHEHFGETCLEAELQTRLGFWRFKQPKPGAVPTIFIFDRTQSHVQQEKKERAQKRTKRRQDLLHQVVGRQFLFRG